MPLRIVIADDHPLILAALGAVLRAADDMEVVGVAETGARAVSLVERERPDVALLDLHMPDRSGLECLVAIRQRAPGTKVVMLSASCGAREVQHAFAAGAAAYLDKRVGVEDVPALLRQVHAGTVCFSAPVPDPVADGLTARERAVLAALIRGLPNRAIAEELWVTEQTVKFHLGNLYRKLGVSSRAEAQRLAYDRGLAIAS